MNEGPTQEQILRTMTRILSGPQCIVDIPRANSRLEMRDGGRGRSRKCKIMESIGTGGKSGSRKFSFLVWFTNKTTRGIVHWRETRMAEFERDYFGKGPKCPTTGGG